MGQNLPTQLTVLLLFLVLASEAVFDTESRSTGVGSFIVDRDKTIRQEKCRSTFFCGAWGQAYVFVGYCSIIA